MGNRVTEIQRKTVLVDGLVTGYLEAGQGDPVVLLHGGEFGVNAELAWENNIAALAAHHHVFAPEMLGFGESAKVVDFNDGRGMRIRHIARFCNTVGVDAAHFVGNSMGAVNLFVDATSESPVLPARTLVMICGGGEIQRNEYSAALYDYDATLSGMRRIVEALFFDPSYPANDAYVQRRYESSIAPGAWETLAAARFRRPGLEPPSLPSSKRSYDRIAVPTLVVEGEGDKLLPPGWAAAIAAQIPGGRSVVVPKAGHCPQIEQPSVVNHVLADFLAEQRSSSRSTFCSIPLDLSLRNVTFGDGAAKGDRNG
jgi:pimeloyl-ACP methyl ester carboxylesterase